MPHKFTQVRYLSISPEQAGQRVDNFLFRELKNVPRSHVYRLLRSGQVRVNGGRVKPTRKLLAGDELRLPPVRDVAERISQRVPDEGRQEITSAIIHEDDGIIVLNKPAGWAVHAGTGIPYGIIDALRQARPDIHYLELAHRLDRETSGCLLLAKNRDVLEQLHDGFRNDGHVIGHRKHYLALLAGEWQGGSRDINIPLVSQRLESGERMVKTALRPDGEARRAHSEFMPLDIFTDCSLVEVRITTGRMHQIRVHAKSLGHPVIGDRKYGERSANLLMRRMGLKRMFLHAHKISMNLTGQELHFEAPMPPELLSHLEKLRHDR